MWIKLLPWQCSLWGFLGCEYNRQWINTCVIVDYAEIHRILMTYFTNWPLALKRHFHLCRETELVGFVYCNNNLLPFSFQPSKHCLGLMKILTNFSQHILFCSVSELKFPRRFAISLRNLCEKEVESVIGSLEVLPKPGSGFLVYHYVTHQFLHMTGNWWWSLLWQFIL